MIHAGRRGIDDAMIHTARQGIDDAMIVNPARMAGLPVELLPPPSPVAPESAPPGSWEPAPGWDRPR
jgi:hypothetical protein